MSNSDDDLPRPGFGQPSASSDAIHSEHMFGSMSESSTDSSEDDGEPAKKKAKMLSPTTGMAEDLENMLATATTVKTTNPVYADFAKNMMAKMGFQKGKGLGKHGQGRTEIVEASRQRGRRGLGLHIEGFEPTEDLAWNTEMEEITADESVDWMPPCQKPVPDVETMRTWIKEGQKSSVREDETEFGNLKILQNVLACKSVFDQLEGEEMRRARTKSNPFETIRGAIFQNRAAMKMANMDHVFDYMFTNPKDEDGKPVLTHNDLLYFADICAGPGGFSEYVLWRKKLDSKGFGFTLKGPCDFKLEEFFTAPSEVFEPHYGVGGIEGDGDIYKPENLIAFRKFVMENTNDEGVHFVMADGGFSVEGQENLQEILSKRLYLCQFLCALSILREGGHFVCKLFDVFTTFSVGLVYLMHHIFEKVTLFKPVTSRPANSERYIVCKHRKKDYRAVHDYMFEVNLQLNNYGATSSQDVIEVVPLNILKADVPFYNYIVSSNDRIGRSQVLSLKKIQVFAKNLDLHEDKQADMREKCLKKWNIPDTTRTAPDKEEPAKKFSKLMGEHRLIHYSRVRRYVRFIPEMKIGKGDSFFYGPYNDWYFVIKPRVSRNRDRAFVWAQSSGQGPYQAESSNYFSHKQSLLDTQKLHSVRSLFEYRAMVVASRNRHFILSSGRSHIYKWDGSGIGKWKKLETSSEGGMVIKLELPKDTLLEVEFVQELRGEGKGQRKVLAVHVIDVLMIYGEDMRGHHFMGRIEKLQKFVKAVNKPSRSDLAPIRVKDIYKFEEIHDLTKKLQMKVVKGCGREPRLCYSSAAGRGYAPSGILLFKTVKDPWTMAWSRSNNRKYFYNVATKQSMFELPQEAIASYRDCLTHRLLWLWPPPDGSQNDCVSWDELLQFVDSKK